MDTKNAPMPKGAAEWKAPAQGAATMTAEMPQEAADSSPHQPAAHFENTNPAQAQNDNSPLDDSSAAKPQSVTSDQSPQKPEAGEVSQGQAANSADTAMAAYGRIVNLLGREVDANADPAKILIEILQKHPDPAQRDAILDELNKTNAINSALAVAKIKARAKQSPEQAPLDEKVTNAESVAEIQEKINSAERDAVKLCAEAIKQGMWDPAEAGISAAEKSRRQNIRQAIKRYQAQYEVHGKAEAEIKAEVQLAVQQQNTTLQNDHKPPMNDATQKAFEEKFRQDNYSRDPKIKKILNKVEEQWLIKTVEKNGKGEIVKDEFVICDGHGQRLDTFSRPAQTPELMKAMRELAARKSADGKPTPAQETLRELEKYVVENQNGAGFVPKTHEQIEIEQAHREIFDTAYRVVAYYLGKDIANALVSDGKYDIAKVLDKIKSNPNMALSDIAASLYLSHRAGTDNPTNQGNIDASLYHQLQGLEINNADNPDLVGRIKKLSDHKALMEKGFKGMRSIFDGYLRENHIDPKDVNDRNFVHILTLSTFFEGKTMEDQRGVVHLNDNAKEILTTLRNNSQGLFNDGDAAAITAFAHHNIGSRLMRDFYGADIKELLSGNTVGECASFVVGELFNQGILTDENQRVIAGQILKAHMTETGLKRLNTLGLPPGMSMILMLAIVMLPMGQQVADEDASEKGGGGGGPRG